MSSLTVEEIRSATFATLSSNWATCTKIDFPNTNFIIKSEPFIRPIIKMGETIVGEIGENGVGIRIGILMVSIFGLAGTGTKTLLDYAERIENIFRRKEISGIVFNEPSTDIKGLDENGFYHILVSIDFTAFVG